MIGDTIRILIADDHPVVRKSLRWLLETDSRFSVIGEAEDGSLAIALVEQCHPDVVLLDLNMPNLNGIEATRIITSKFPGTRVIVLTMHGDEEYSRHAFHAGASCFLPKGCSRDEILDAIRSSAMTHLTERMSTFSA